MVRGKKLWLEARNYGVRQETMHTRFAAVLVGQPVK